MTINSKTEVAIKNRQSKETYNIGYTRRRQTTQKHNTICVGHHFKMHYALIQNKQKTKTINYDIYCFRAYVYISKTHQNSQLWYILFYIGYTRRRQTTQKHNTICVGHHFKQTNTNKVNKT
jgi:hypothetical protein